MTIDLKRTGSSTRRKVEASARKVTSAHDFPDWRCVHIEKMSDAPNICLVIGHVQ